MAGPGHNVVDGKAFVRRRVGVAAGGLPLLERVEGRRATHGTADGRIRNRSNFYTHGGVRTSSFFPSPLCISREVGVGSVKGVVLREEGMLVDGHTAAAPGVGNAIVRNASVVDEELVCKNAIVVRLQCKANDGEEGSVPRRSSVLKPLDYRPMSANRPTWHLRSPVARLSMPG